MNGTSLTTDERRNGVERKHYRNPFCSVPPCLRVRLVPELAESLDHPDELTYVAHLRHGVRFHDGRELTAEDVGYTFRSLIDPTFKGRTGAYTNLRAIDILDPYTVAFRQNPEVDRLIDSASAAVDDGERERLYGQVQQTVARDVPYIPLWYKTNVAVFQPDLQGVRLSPIADFTFLKNVSRERTH